MGEAPSNSDFRVRQRSGSFGLSDHGLAPHPFSRRIVFVRRLWLRLRTFADGVRAGARHRSPHERRTCYLHRYSFAFNFYPDHLLATVIVRPSPIWLAKIL